MQRNYSTCGSMRINATDHQSILTKAYVRLYKEILKNTEDSLKMIPVAPDKDVLSDVFHYRSCNQFTPRMTPLIILLLYIVSSVYGIAFQTQCMNFYGLETQRNGLVCDWKHQPRYYMEILKEKLSINTIRLPFSYEYIKEGNLEVMDQFMLDAFDLGLRVIFDYHRTWKSHQGPNPEEGITWENFMETWKILLFRYENFTNILGLGVFNELQDNNTTYQNNMHRMFIKEIEELYPNRFYYFCGCIGWGGNCSTINLKDMDEWERIVYEVHKYSFSGPQSTYDWDISIPRSVSPEHWFVGEIGWKQGDPEQVKWAEEFLAYLQKRHITNVCAWTIAHSGDTEGWWKDDCETYDFNKSALLETLWYGSFKKIRDHTNLRT